MGVGEGERETVKERERRRESERERERHVWLCGLEAINNRWEQYEMGNCMVSATSITVMEGSSDQFFAGA